jgi:transposase
MAERRTFTHEYKQEAVRLLTERKLSVSDASRQLGVGVNLLRKWRQALEAGGEQAPPEKRQQTVLEEENRRLRTENERLRMEREILKKATVFFAKESR